MNVFPTSDDHDQCHIVAIILSTKTPLPHIQLQSLAPTTTQQQPANVAITSFTSLTIVVSFYSISTQSLAINS